MKVTLFPLFAVLGLSACATTAPPIEITEPPVEAQVLAGAPVERIRERRKDTVIRAYQAAKTKDGKDTRLEVANANCTLTSDHLTAEVVTPQIVRLPLYDQIGSLEDRGVPPSVLVECEKENLKGESLIAAKPGQLVASSSGNLIADLIVLAGSAAVASAQDWRYADGTEVTME